MRRFFDPRQLAHRPALEFHNGALVPYMEVPLRAEHVLAALGKMAVPPDAGMAPLLAIHDAEYLAFLREAPARWAAAGRPGDVIAYTWPVVGRRPLKLTRVDAQAGRYSYDAATPITPDTWASAYAGAQAAIAAVDAALAGETGFALCRPPGHHAGRDYCGGYCYLNNAAIAAQRARDAGTARVAILDIDYHHGNGTQDIFRDRGDVLFVSIHADPATDYPFYWGHADERGEGEGAGTTLNLPLLRGTDVAGYGQALAAAARAIGDFAPELLVVSFGADTYAGDPISKFALRTGDYPELARSIAALGLPTAIVMEGGYAVEVLGHNVAGFLSGFG